MKQRRIAVIASILAIFTIVNVQAQRPGGAMGGMGGMGMGGARPPEWSGKIAKLFGDNSTFSADVEMQTKAAGGSGAMNVPGTIHFDNGKSRFEMDLLKSGRGGPEAAQQMKAMGMDKMVMISRPDKKLSYLVYPGLKSYVEMAQTASDTNNNDFKLETTQLGKETVDGHPTVKTRAVLTDKEGNKHEWLLWNATDLKNFPVKIEQTQEQGPSTVLFKNVKLAKPEASMFEPPQGMKRYESMQAMMQEEMMKRMMGGRQNLPPGHP